MAHTQLDETPDPVLNPAASKPKASTPQDPRRLDAPVRNDAPKVQGNWLGKAGLPID